MHPGQRHSGVGREVLQPAGGGMTVHPDGAQVAQDRPVGAAVHGPLDRPLHRGREWGEDDLAALAADLQHPVAVFLAEVGDVGAALVAMLGLLGLRIFEACDTDRLLRPVVLECSSRKVPSHTAADP